MNQSLKIWIVLSITGLVLLFGAPIMISYLRSKFKENHPVTHFSDCECKG